MTDSKLPTSVNFESDDQKSYFVVRMKKNYTAEELQMETAKWLTQQRQAYLVK